MLLELFELIQWIFFMDSHILSLIYYFLQIYIYDNFHDLCNDFTPISSTNFISYLPQDLSNDIASKTIEHIFKTVISLSIDKFFMIYQNDFSRNVIKNPSKYLSKLGRTWTFINANRNSTPASFETSNTDVPISAWISMRAFWRKGGSSSSIDTWMAFKAQHSGTNVQSRDFFSVACFNRCGVFGWNFTNNVAYRVINI